MEGCHVEEKEQEGFWGKETGNRVRDPGLKHPVAAQGHSEVGPVLLNILAGEMVGVCWLFNCDQTSSC